MSSYDVIHIQHGCASIESLSSEHPAKRAIVLFADLSNYCIHCPPIELIVTKDFKRHIVLLLIPFDSLAN
jgi:hypothetical protein